MLHFLRRIRRSLINTGATRKYLMYAVGEIALVVIGILIALQINNWNEDKQIRKYEVKILKELLSSIKSDYRGLEFGIATNKRVQTSCEIILFHFDNNLPYNDSLDYHFMNSCNWMSLLVRKNGYENAKSHGLDFISDSLRDLLTGFYEGAIVFGDVMQNRQNLYYYNTVVPLLTGLFEETISPLLFQKGVVPYDYEGLKGELKYRNILRSSIRNRGNENDWFGKILKKLKNLELKLLAEIENR